MLQWDKDDCAAIGLVKFDLLGLGMLSALRYCFELRRAWHGMRYDLHEIPPEDPLVYDMVCTADTVGVFQIESRAQMATLPRLRPAEVLRPGHRGRADPARADPGRLGAPLHPPPARPRGGHLSASQAEAALERTLGIPLFQEQLMQLAVDAANFTPPRPIKLRRAMGSKRSDARIEALRQRLYDGMARQRHHRRACRRDLSTRSRRSPSFGFAESHAISFALLVYASSAG